MITRICVPLSTRNLCRCPCTGKRRHQSRFRGMLLLMDCYASVTLLGNSTTTFAPLLFNIVFSSATLRSATTWDFISHCLPKKPLTMSGARLLTLFTPPQERMILNYGRTVLSLSLKLHLDPLHYYKAPKRQMVSLWRSIVQQPAYSHAHREQSDLPLKWL
ncbi:hypothetical protein TcG_06948 [Trypanosoma cruzi]|nr:hypothetical protein TcG_06948 [Trypanosoma cruzi]